jgi:hypothetical protein
MAHVAGSAARGGASYDVSARGTLVTVAPADGRPLARVAWIERDGRTTRTTLPDGRYDFVELSPDRGRIALWADGQIAVGDLARGVVTSITSLGGGHPTWSPDGRFVAYQRGSRLYVADSRAGPDSERPLSEEVFDSPQSLRWTADGSGIAFSAAQPHWDHDLLFLPLTAAADGWPVASASRALVRTKAAELFPRVSPDGRWLAYVAGQVYAAGQIFVQSSASSSDRTQVSPRNGTQPVWSRDGREILFRVDDELWAAPVETKPPLRVGTARRLATVPGLLSYVAADDRRLLVISAIETGRRSIRELHVVVNWQAELAASRGPHR